MTQTTERFNTIVRSLNPNIVGVGYQKLSVTDAAAVSLTAPEGTKYCEIMVESATTTGFVVNYLNSMSAGSVVLPTATDGIPVSHGTLFDIQNSDGVTNFRAICRAGLSATLHIQYYK